MRLYKTPRLTILLILTALGITLGPLQSAAQSAAASEAALPDAVFNAESFTLENGLQVVVIPNDRAPVVTHMVWYKVGAADEKSGLSGLAHYVEHLMFKGSENVAPGAFSKTVRALGGQDNAFTSSDYTAYYQSVAAEHLEKVMAMEADRMRGLLFPPDELAAERQVVIEERRERTENDPRGYFGEQLRAALYINHPYGDPVIGWLHELGALENGRVQEFYNRWYAPNNAILIVAGAVTAAELRPLAEQYYGTIPRKDIPARNWTAVPPLPAPARLTMHHETIRQPAFNRLYRVPSAHQDKQTALALQVLSNIMDGSAAARLYRELVVNQKIATNINFRYDPLHLSDSTIGISAIPAPGVPLETLEKAIDDQLRLLIDEGVSADEIAEAKARMIDQAVYARDSLSGPAMIFGRALTTGAEIDDVEYWPANIQAVTAAQIHEAARRYLDPDHFDMRPYVTGYLLPAPAATDEAATDASHKEKESTPPAQENTP